VVEDGELSTIRELLGKAGCCAKEIENFSYCAMAGLVRGHFGFVFTGEASDLDRFISSDTVISSPCCKVFEKQVTIREILSQKDFPESYCSQGKAVVECPECNENLFLGGMCRGETQWTFSKYYQHCRECDDLGNCVGDSRNGHCYDCNSPDHYFAGRYSAYKCQCSEAFEIIENAMQGNRAALAALYFYEMTRGCQVPGPEEEEEDDLFEKSKPVIDRAVKVKKRRFNI
jgi:hypothetical protein